MPWSDTAGPKVRSKGFPWKFAPGIVGAGTGTNNQVSGDGGVSGRSLPVAARLRSVMLGVVWNGSVRDGGAPSSTQIL